MALKKRQTMQQYNSTSTMNGDFASFMVQKVPLYDEIKKSSGSILDADDHATKFLDLFESELNRVSQVISSQQELQELSAKVFLSNVEAIVNNGVVAAELLNLRHKADDIADKCLKLQRFVKTNTETLREIANCADNELHTTSLLSLGRRFSRAPWKEGPNSAVIVLLSDIYSTIRDAETQNQKNAGMWVAPTSFERTTTKYWIQEDKLTDLLLAAVKEAPLLVYGRSGKLTGKSELTEMTHEEGDKLWDSLVTPVSSVYFDSPSMSMYKERIKRCEGSQLFRVRWYGTKPSGDDLLFLELKTHHEKWINEMSVKERCVIREKDMRRFLASENWTPEIAKELVLGGTPNLAGEQLDKQIELCEAMHNIVISNNLRPTVRTMYTRAAFQSQGSNSLRLTLDRHVTVTDETGAPPGFWCLPDDAVMDEELARRMPYLIFEIKLSGSDMPAVFRTLVQRGIMMEAAKFSKYITGAASFNAHKVDSLPYWAEDPAFKDIIILPERGQSKQASTGKKITSLMSMRRRINSDMIGDAVDFQNVRPVVNKRSNLVKEVNASLTQATSVSQSVNTSQSIFLSQSINTGSKEYSSTSNNLRQRKNQEKDVEKSSNGFKEKNSSVLPQKPVRVEPKSFFANERTFIQWISAALMLVTISAILFRDLKGMDDIPTTSGIILNIVAVFVIFYAMYAYYHRVRLLLAGSTYGYIDHLGPVLLAMAVLLGVVILLYYYIDAAMHTQRKRQESVDSVRATLTPVSGSCIQRPLDGVDLDLFQFEPSGVAVSTARNTILVSSLQEITELNVAWPFAPVQTLVRIPEADLEGITVVDNDRVFAISEGVQEPLLIELEWDTNQLDVVNTWELNTMQKVSNGLSEGIAYVPNANGGSLYIAGDLLDPLSPDPKTRGVIHIFDVPDKDDDNEDSLTRRSTINGNLLNKGLKDSKIGDLHYFEGVLYVLNDNARVIRSWDIKTGELLATIPLPQVPDEEFDRQWEGMALERASESNARLGRNMQGGPEYSLVLHLALDTPPQVWSFGVNQLEDAPGSLVFPDCAAAN